jgi:hypothetical protein
MHQGQKNFLRNKNRLPKKPVFGERWLAATGAAAAATGIIAVPAEAVEKQD